MNIGSVVRTDMLENMCKISANERKGCRRKCENECAGRLMRIPVKSIGKTNRVI
jgi:hypothetical protein